MDALLLQAPEEHSQQRVNSGLFPDKEVKDVLGDLDRELAVENGEEEPVWHTDQQTLSDFSDAEFIHHGLVKGGLGGLEMANELVLQLFQVWTVADEELAPIQALHNRK